MFEMQTKQESATVLKKSPETKTVIAQRHASSPFVMNPVSIARTQNKNTAAPAAGHPSKGIVQRDLKSVRQEGATCGLHALATALYDMAPDIRNHVDANMSDEDIIFFIVNKLKEFTPENATAGFYVSEPKNVPASDTESPSVSANNTLAGKCTIVGEAFDANILCELGNQFCKNGGYNELNGISLEVQEFDDDLKLNEIIDKCESGKAYVLFPYFAFVNNGSLPCIPEDVASNSNTVQPDKMYRAHWSVIEKTTQEGNYHHLTNEANASSYNIDEKNNPNFEDKEEKGSLHILEGHQKLYGGAENSYLDKDRIKKLFLSNQRLADQFSWSAYIDLYNDEEARTKLGSIISNNTINTERYVPADPNGEISTKNISEKANLRGRAILIKRT